jgi:5-amino-6-(5-phospho-D-ribitylamino)uracil phosphatase
MTNNNNIKLVVIDIDGTLLVRADEISRENKIALQELREHGITVSLCSGRATPAARGVLNQLGLKGYHIFFDGALVTDPDTQENLYIKSLERRLIKQALDYAQENGLIMDVFSATTCYMAQESWVADIRRKYFKVQPVIKDFRYLPEAEEFIKGTLVVRSPEEKAGAERFRQRFIEAFVLSKTKTPAYPDTDFINVLAPGVSKRSALEILMNHLGVKPEQVMAIGDGLNDIPLITAAGWGVAMGNAIPEVKASARYITEDVEHDGVARAIKTLVLN